MPAYIFRAFIDSLLYFLFFLWVAILVVVVEVDFLLLLGLGNVVTSPHCKVCFLVVVFF